MIAIGGNPEIPVQNKGFDGPGEGMDVGIMVLIPGETLVTGIDVIAARKAATDDPRSIPEHGQRL